ncbi:MAG: PEP-CTERM sorting domain-containing protein [Acidobacteriota bacterium]|jgi:hypothetical protein
MKKLLLLSSMFLLVSTVALADGLPVTVDLEFQGVDPGINYYNGWPTGHHIVEITNSPGGVYDSVFYGFCVDPASAEDTPTPYTLIYVPENLYGAAWVFENFEGLGESASNAQVAIWNLAIPGLPPMTGPQQSLFDSANTAVGEGYIPPDSILLAYSPAGAGESFDVPFQDFLIRVPEPGSILLLGLGLLGVATVSRLKKR